MPGIKVVAPSHAHDPGRLLRHAVLADEDPVLFIEHKLLYPLPLGGGERLSITLVEEIPGYPTALVANFAHGEPDVTVIAYGGAARHLLAVMAALRDEEVNVLAALPASLKPTPLATLADAAARSGRVVIAEEGSEGFNWGSEIAALLYERLWNRLARPIARLASAASVIPCAKQEEDRLLLNGETIEAAILEAIE